VDIWSAIILGIIQGLTEYIPVSSTAHLIVVSEFLPGRPTDPHAFDTIIQFGTVLPVLVYFRRDWLDLLRGFFRVVTRRRVSEDLNERLAVLVILASLPAAIFGVLLNKRVEALARVDENPAGYVIIGIALIGVGVLMWWVDAVARKQRELNQMAPVDAIFIGLAQAVALIPGVSRSGATITAGLCTGLTREAAARFSFLIATPVLLGAVAFKLRHLVSSPTPMPSGEWLALGLGTVAAAVVGYLSIAFLMAYLRRHSLALFAVYRVVLGLFLILLWWQQTR
jgi:undecaprenyl-diphosphatase